MNFHLLALWFVLLDLALRAQDSSVRTKEFSFTGM